MFGEDDGMPLLLEPAAEQEPVHAVVVRDEDRAGRGSGTAHDNRFRPKGGESRLERPVLLLDPIHELRDAVEAAVLGVLLDGAAELRERRRAQRRAVRLQRVRRSAELLGVLALERAAEARDQRRRIRKKDVHHLGEELDAAEVSQVLERGSLEADLALSRTSVTVS